jgi:hypothetical protein
VLPQAFHELCCCKKAHNAHTDLPLHPVVPTNLNIQRYIRARNPLRMDTQEISAFMSPKFPNFLGKVANSPPFAV